MLAAGVFHDLFPATMIDPTNPFPPMPEIGANVTHGEYFARSCQEWHGPDLSGEQPPDPASPFAPNLTMTGEMIAWNEADFMTAMTIGATPDGRTLDTDFMPWGPFSKLSPVELRGIFMYLQTLPAVQ